MAPQGLVSAPSSHSARALRWRRGNSERASCRPGLYRPGELTNMILRPPRIPLLSPLLIGLLLGGPGCEPSDDDVTIDDDSVVGDDDSAVGDDDSASDDDSVSDDDSAIGDDDTSWEVPTVVLVSPQDGALGVARNEHLSATFTVEMHAADFTVEMSGIRHHRDYSILGSRVLLEVFDDRVVITSPGSLPNHLRPESVLAGAHPRSRNELMAHYLLVRGLMESRGRGFLKIRAAMARFNGSQPSLEAHRDDRFVRVTLLRARPGAG